MEQREAANQGIVLTPMKRRDDRSGRIQRNRSMTNMKANRNTGTNETRALSAVELDAVSGGGVNRAFDFTVAGMHIYGGYSPDGNYGVVVNYGNNSIVQGGKV
jgi:hypothetical protein